MSRDKPLYWREAASLILTAPRVPDSFSRRQGPSSTGDSPTVRSPEFDVLMLKRGKSSSFMANVYVFPGGVASEADFDARGWTGTFQRVTGRSMAQTVRDFEVTGQRPPMMVKDDNFGRYLAPEIAFRISAIRETFEESGVLLVTHKSQVQQAGNSFNCGGGVAPEVPPMWLMPREFPVSKWRAALSAKAEAFQRLCEENDVIPNIWALFEWSNWLTPVFVKAEGPPRKPKRFDTLFFVCCLESVPTGIAENETEEISSVEWATPTSWFSRGKSKEITLVGPQYYETSRLATFRDTRDLLRYAGVRQPLGLQRWMSVSYICRDGVLFVLPGDELYPSSPDYEGVKDLPELDDNVLAVCKRATHFHRGIRGSWDYYCNVSLPSGLLVHSYAKRTFPESLDLPSYKL